MRLSAVAAPLAIALLAPSCQPACVPGPVPATNIGIVWHSEVDPTRVLEGDGTPLVQSGEEGVLVALDMLLVIDRRAAGELSAQCDAEILAASTPAVTRCLYVQYAVGTGTTNDAVTFNLGGLVAEGTYDLLGGDRDVRLSGGHSGLRFSRMHVDGGPDMLVWWSTTVAGRTTVHTFAVPTSSYLAPISFGGSAVGPN